MPFSFFPPFLRESIVCFYVVHSFEKEDFLKNLHILSCFVQLKRVLCNLLCVWDLFFRTPAVNSVSELVFFSKRKSACGYASSFKIRQTKSDSCMQMPEYKIFTPNPSPCQLQQGKTNPRISCRESHDQSVCG